MLHCRTKSICGKEGEEHLCSVCLDAFAEGVQVCCLILNCLLACLLDKHTIGVASLKR